MPQNNRSTSTTNIDDKDKLYNNSSNDQSPTTFSSSSSGEHHHQHRARGAAVRYNMLAPIAILENVRAKSEMIDYVIHKRVKNLDYLRRVHDGQVFWLNVVKISASDIERYYHPQTLQKRYYYHYMCVSV